MNKDFYCEYHLEKKQQDLFPSKLIEIDSSSDDSSNSSSELSSDSSQEEIEQN